MSKFKLTDDAKAEVEQLAVSAVEDWLEDGEIESDKAVDLLADGLDALLPLDLLLPGALGKVAEEWDDKLVHTIAEALVKAFRLDPDKIEKRAQRAEDRGHDKVAARRRRRAERVRKRQAEKSGD